MRSLGLGCTYLQLHEAGNVCEVVGWWCGGRAVCVYACSVHTCRSVRLVLSLSREDEYSLCSPTGGVFLSDWPAV